MSKDLCCNFNEKFSWLLLSILLLLESIILISWCRYNSHLNQSNYFHYQSKVMLSINIPYKHCHSHCRGPELTSPLPGIDSKTPSLPSYFPSSLFSSVWPLPLVFIFRDDEAESAILLYYFLYFPNTEESNDSISLLNCRMMPVFLAVGNQNL